MKKALLFAAVTALWAGACARFTTVQTDERLNPKTGEKTTITTGATATTFVAGKSALANWKASQTEKTQGAAVGSLAQESDATSIVKAAVEAAVTAGAKSALPIK